MTTRVGMQLSVHSCNTQTQTHTQQTYTVEQALRFWAKHQNRYYCNSQTRQTHSQHTFNTQFFHNMRRSWEHAATFFAMSMGTDTLQTKQRRKHTQKTCHNLGCTNTTTTYWRRVGSLLNQTHTHTQTHTHNTRTHKKQLKDTVWRLCVLHLVFQEISFATHTYTHTHTHTRALSRVAFNATFIPEKTDHIRSALRYASLSLFCCVVNTTKDE